MMPYDSDRMAASHDIYKGGLLKQHLYFIENVPKNLERKKS